MVTIPTSSSPLVTGSRLIRCCTIRATASSMSISTWPVTNGDDLVGIVTIDDLAVRAGDLHQAQQITAEVAKAALPEFYFHQRGG